MPAPPRGDSTDASAPSDLPLSGLSVFDALQKQLGLKLEKKDMDHVTVPVLVIDHIEQKPTDN